MKLNFVKMQAQGNDFVILDGLRETVPDLTQAFVSKICDRRWGIGCDQLLILQAHDKADALMLIYNADGSQAGNCGNGLRCVADLLMKKLVKLTVSIALSDRLVKAERTSDGICVTMGQAEIECVNDHYMDVFIGNPHRVYFNQAQRCPERNVEIISAYNKQQAVISIIERGAGETQACGSGACATAVAVWQRLATVEPLTIVMPGGKVAVHKVGTQILLTGFVTHVFDGEYVVV